MKRSILFAALLGMLTLLLAAPAQLAIVSGQKTSLHELATTLIGEGQTVYYYNDNYMVARLDPTKYSAKYPGEPQKGEQLYLIQGLSADERLKLSSLGALHPLGERDALLISSANDVLIREFSPGSFTELSHNPLRSLPRQAHAQTLRQIDPQILQMVSMVNADSVSYFLQSLQDLQTRYALAENRLAVATWIKDTFVRFGIANTYLEEFTWNGTQQYNVVATIEGTTYPDEYIVVGGHHDSVTYNQPHLWAPGADDNASGTVAAIETARVMMASSFQPKCSIRFITFAAEEFGLHGSHFNAQEAENAGTNIRLMINHDMIANNSNNSGLVRLMPYNGSEALNQVASDLVEDYSSLQTVYGNLNSSSSDSYAYWSRGYPVLYFFEMDFSEVYHSDDDTMANLDPHYCTEVIKASLACTANFAMMPGMVQGANLTDVGDGNSLLISWEEITDPSVTNVLIRYSTTDPTNEQPIMVSEGTSYLVQGLVTGENYNFSLCVSNSAGFESPQIYFSGSPMLNPRTPENLVAVPLLNAIGLSWEANHELDFAGYRLYRASSPELELVLVSDGLLTEPEYLDTEVEGDPEIIYTYKVQAVDTTGNTSELSGIAGGRPATFDNGILLIDATAGGNGSGPFMPTNQMVSDYYTDVLSGFDVHNLDLAEVSRDIRLYDICIYSTIIWHDVDSTTDILPQDVVKALGEYVALGGNLLYNGYFPGKALAGNAGYPAEFNDQQVIRNVFGAASADYVLQARLRMALSQEDLVPDLTVGNHASMEAFNFHIIKVEALYPTASAEIWYTYHSDYDSGSPYAQMQGYPIGIYNEYLQGRSLLLSFPLYVMNQQDVSQLLYGVLHHKWGESTGNEDTSSPAITELKISPSYPNPFRNSTSFQVTGAGKDSGKIKIYNLRGQMIRELKPQASGEYTWDGMDHRGSSVSSGIYFARVSDGGRYAQRKLIRLK